MILATQHAYRLLMKLLDWGLAIVMAALLLDVIWGVLSRMLGTFHAWLAAKFLIDVPFLPHGQSVWSEELARFLLIWVGFLGAARVFADRGHLGVDFIVERLHPSARHLMTLVSWVCVVVFSLLVLIFGGTGLVMRTYELGQITPALGIAKAWIYLVVPISGGLILMIAAKHLFNLLTQSNKNLISYE